MDAVGIVIDPVRILSRQENIFVPTEKAVKVQSYGRDDGRAGGGGGTLLITTAKLTPMVRRVLL
jgi:hypothetical protein